MMFIVNRIEPKIGQNGRNRPKNADPCESKALNLQPNIYAPKPAGSVIGAVAQEEIDRVGDLVEQGTDLRSVIDVAVGQDGGDDPAGHRVKADVQFAPGTPL